MELLDRWRRPWVIQIIGTESGNATMLDFLRFKTEDEAAEWIEKQPLGAGLTYYRALDTRVSRR